MQQIIININNIVYKQKDALQEFAQKFDQVPAKQQLINIQHVADDLSRKIFEAHQNAVQDLSANMNKVLIRNVNEFLEVNNDAIKQKHLQGIQQFAKGLKQEDKSIKEQNNYDPIQSIQNPTNFNYIQGFDDVNLGFAEDFDNNFEKKFNNITYDVDPQKLYKEQNKTRLQEENSSFHDKKYKKVKQNQQIQLKSPKPKKRSELQNQQLQYLQQNKKHGNSQQISLTEKAQRKRKPSQENAKNHSNSLIKQPGSGNKNTQVYKMSKDSTRKNSLKRQKQAQNQLLANIQFLHSVRGSMIAQNKSSPKSWKQQKISIRNTAKQIRQNKKKHLQTLGFGNAQQSKLLQSKLGSSQNFSPEQSLLPQIKQSRRKGQIFKPTAFSVYSIQKVNQIFYNNPVK